MRAVIQRVQNASVTVSSQIASQIGKGLLILLGIEEADTSEDLDWLSSKIAKMRLFDDADGKINLSLLDIAGEALVVSQFTLFASTKKGNRPSFIKAAPPELAHPLYQKFCQTLATHLSKPVAQGIFGASMQIALLNDGPVTILIDSKNRE